MKKIISFMISILFLLSCSVSVTAAEDSAQKTDTQTDSQSTTVRYTVSAKVNYKDSDGSSTSQEVKPGDTIKPPEPEKKPDADFDGWKDEDTGKPWDFDQPVTGDLDLVADYSKPKPAGAGKGTTSVKKGSFTVDVKTGNSEIKADLLTSRSDLLSMLRRNGSITSKEIKQLENGADVKVVLVINDNADQVSAASKAKLDSAADGYTIGQYMNIELVKYITVNGKTGKGQPITQTPDKVTVSLKVPFDLINNDGSVERSYLIICNKDGEVNTIEPEYDPVTQTLTFLTDRFADYAIAYKDTEKSSQTTQNAANGTQDKNASATSADAGQFNIAHAVIYAIIPALAAAFILILLFKRKKKKEDEE